MENFKYAILVVVNKEKYLSPVLESKEETLDVIKKTYLFYKNTSNPDIVFSLNIGGFLYIPPGTVFSLVPVKLSVSNSGVVNYDTYTLLTPSEL